MISIFIRTFAAREAVTSVEIKQKHQTNYLNQSDASRVRMRARYI